MGGTIGFWLFDGMEELDMVGPYEMFSVWTQLFPDAGRHTVTFSVDGRPVTAAKGLCVGARCSVADITDLDVLVYPGGDGRRALMTDQAHLDWLRAQRARTRVLASVCTGSLVLAAAGLLAGRPATTHWQALDELGAVDATVDVRRDERWVDDGDVVTAAGVSAGIDMTLAVIARLGNVTQAQQVRRWTQYDPQPPV